MYSGITRGLFDVVYVDRKTGLLTYSVRLNDQLIHNLTVGASVAIDGVCQTVVSIVGYDVTFNAIQDTLDRTTLDSMVLLQKVSVERSVCYGDEIGGHEVAGHVIGTAQIIDILSSKNNLTIHIQCNPAWMKYILPKGFIAVDGSSLTVDLVDPKGVFTLNLIPETLRVTNFGNKKIGDLVNIELDHRTQAIVATVERLLSSYNSFA